MIIYVVIVYLIYFVVDYFNLMESYDIYINRNTAIT